jgi:hypothetical protein
MKISKILTSVALAGLVLSLGTTARPAAAQVGIACPPGYYFLPGIGCQLVAASNLNYSQLNYSYGYQQPYDYAPYPYPYYAPFAVTGGGFGRGFHDHDGRGDRRR